MSVLRAPLGTLRHAGGDLPGGINPTKAIAAPVAVDARDPGQPGFARCLSAAARALGRCSWRACPGPSPSALGLITVSERVPGPASSAHLLSRLGHHHRWHDGRGCPGTEASVAADERPRSSAEFGPKVMPHGHRELRPVVGLNATSEVGSAWARRLGRPAPGWRERGHSRNPVGVCASVFPGVRRAPGALVLLGSDRGAALQAGPVKPLLCNGSAGLGQYVWIDALVADP